jgi:hypothetical protein
MERGIGDRAVRLVRHPNVRAIEGLSIRIVSYRVAG